MKLIETIDGKWYWCVDNSQVGYHQSISYDTEDDAVIAGFKGNIKWD